MFKKGDKVRHCRQITRSGYCLCDAEDGEVEVLWATGDREWVSLGQLERPTEIESADPVELLLQGRHGGIDDLRQVLSQAIFSGQLSEMIYSMDATKTKFLAHQFKPVLSILESPSQGILIADEVGLGKTIEAGLIWTELRFRKRARKLLVICPAMLTEKWRLELLTKFGTEARVANATELLNYLENEERDSRPVHAFICSLQGVRPPPRYRERVGKRPPEVKGSPAEDQRPYRDNSDRARLARYLDLHADEAQPLFDFVVIDEAHHLKNPDTSSNRLGNLLRPVSDYIALLSATPINNRDEDLYSLLRVIDPAFYTSDYVFKTSLDANRPLVKAAMLLRRSQQCTIADLCAEIEESSGLFTQVKLAQLPQFLRELKAMDQEQRITPEMAILYAERLEGMNLFASTISRTRKRDVEEARKVRRVHKHEITLSPLEAEAYEVVTQAIQDYADSNLSTPSFMLMTPQRQMTSCIHAAISGWRERLQADSEELDEDIEDELLVVPDSQPILEAVSECVHDLDLHALYRGDSKYLKLASYLKEHFAESPHDKVIVFSTFRRTLAYLQERLAKDGVSALIVQGGSDKVQVIETFQKTPAIRVLLASEVASEGVDLQFMSTLVNYDLPWNPMRIEQRIGRLDRFGQEASVVNIVNLYHLGTIDERIMELLDVKLDIFEQALGGLDEIIGDAIQELSRTLTLQSLTEKERDDQLKQTELALVQKKRHQAEIEAREGELIGLKDLLQRKIENAHATQATIRDKDLVDYVKRFLTRYADRHQCPFEMRAESAVTHGYSIVIPAPLRQELRDYVAARRLAPSTLMQSESNSVVFDCTVSSQSLQRGRERITQFHPLVDFINAQVTAEPDRHFWIAIELMAKEVQAELGQGEYQFVVERWCVQGIRTQDTLRMALTPLGADDYAETKVVDGAGLLNSMRSLGATWTTAVSAGMTKEGLGFARRESISRLRADYRAFEQQHKDQNSDRHRTSAAAAEKKRAMQLQKLQDRLQELGGSESAQWRSQQSRIENDYKKTVSSLDEGSLLQATRTTLASGVLKVI